MSEDKDQILSNEEIQKRVDEGQPGDGYDYVRDAQKIQRDATAPEIPMTEPRDGEEHIYLPGLLSDEFGLSRSQARQEIVTGTVTIDDKIVSFLVGRDGPVLTIPKSLCAGKTVVVKGGGFRAFAVQIPDAA